ncbi:MAG: aldehyde dehydrogenase [Chloroflexi bacterium]|nr:aldehyde dehydrogenase [Chloroflexota bacterium]
MRYGVTGIDLEIDLSRSKIEKVQTNQALTQAYLGGKGTNARILWERVPPEVDAFSPRNLLIVGAGALVGTMVPSANRTTVTYKSPVTDIHSYSVFGGYFGAKLKFAGYDTIILSGKSPTPVYLWINNDQVELRDASHLWGKDTRETQKMLREELQQDEAEILCIGQAGENRVYSASIEHGPGASASRGGAGAVMGDKKLKAIAVHGTKDVNIANPARLVELCEPILKRTAVVRSLIYDCFGHSRVQGYFEGVDYGYPRGQWPTELRKKLGDLGGVAQNFMDTKRARKVACYNCAQRCHQAFRCPDGDYAYLKCMSWEAGVRATRSMDMDFALAFYQKCEKYGLDSISFPYIIAFAINLYEKGILTKADTGGLHLEWENADVAFALMDKIVRREGIGDVLADGIYRAAQRIGKGAEELVAHTKKIESGSIRRKGPPGTRHIAITSLINDKGDSTKLIGSWPDTYWERAAVDDPKDRDAYLKSAYYHYPKEFKKYLLSEDGEADFEGACLFMSHQEETYTLGDAAGLCYYWLGHHPSPPIGSRSLIADLISAATGLDIDEAGATRIAKRIVNVVRAYNVRAGIRRKDDSIPGTPDNPLFAKCVDKWYELKGWDKDGIPTPETLVGLGLDDVRQELERRGILVVSYVPVSVH